MNQIAQRIAERMATYPISPEIQVRQTAYRVKLADFWGIQAVQQVLEIGCGQGDTTAVLLDRVGPVGRVFAVDTGEPDYGSPVTIGDSMAHLATGPLGKGLEYQLGASLLDLSPPDSPVYDIALLAHCTWYFRSSQELVDLLQALHSWTGKVCITEWDLQNDDERFEAHRLAVRVQDQVERFRPTTSANVRCAFTKDEVVNILEETDWRVIQDSGAMMAGLDDGRWEVENTLTYSDELIVGLPLTLEERQTIHQELDQVRRLSKLRAVETLPSFTLIAESIQGI